MILKNVTIEELKKDYSVRNGFVFLGSSHCNSSLCEKAAANIQSHGYCDTMPEFIGELNSQLFVFVYPEGAPFKTPEFLQFCSHWSTITQGFKVDSLSAWLKEQN